MRMLSLLRYASKSPQHLQNIIEMYSNCGCLPMNDKFLHMYAAKLFIQLHPPEKLDDWPSYIRDIIKTPYITTNTFFEILSIIHLIYEHFNVEIRWPLLRFYAFISCRNAIQNGGDSKAQFRSLLRTVIFHCPLYPCCVADIFCIDCFYDDNPHWRKPVTPLPLL